MGGWLAATPEAPHEPQHVTNAAGDNSLENGLYEAITGSAIFPWALSTITGLISFWAGNRAALGRDRRNEYNAIADQVRGQLIRLRGAHSHCIHDISEADLDLLYRRAGRFQAARLRKAVQGAIEAEERGTRQDEIGQPILVDPSAMRASRERIIELIPHH